MVTNTSSARSVSPPITWPAPDAVAEVAAAMRQRTLDTVARRRGGYLIQTCSAAEILATLCLALADPGHVPGSTGCPGRRHGLGSTYLNAAGPHDHRLIVSPGHYALALYTALIEVHKLPESALEAYGAADSPLELIGADYSPGFEVIGGSLGQGLSQAVGIAMGRQMRGDTGRTFVLISDGELQEGQTWEAVQCAHHHDVRGLSIVVDANGQQVDGELAQVMDIEPIDVRFAAFGLDVAVVDGHDVTALTSALSRPARHAPAVTICRTQPDRGMPFVAEIPPQRRHGLWFASDAEFEPVAATAAVLGSRP